MVHLYLENHEKMPLQISDKTFKRFPLPLSTSLCAYFPLYAINGSDYKSPTVELVSYFEREFLSFNNKPLVLDLSIGKSKLKPLGRFKPKNFRFSLASERG